MVMLLALFASEEAGSAAEMGACETVAAGAGLLAGTAATFTGAGCDAGDG